MTSKRGAAALRLIEPARSLTSRLANRRFLLETTFLGLTFLSAIGFTCSNFLARLFSQQSLPVLIEFQSVSVFLTFIVQAGLRAGLRNQYHLGRRRVVATVERRILLDLPWVAGIVSAAFLLQSRFEICPAFAILQAILTLLIGLRIAQGRLSSAAGWSALTFLSIVSACLLIMASALPFAKVRILIELVSVGVLFTLRGRRRAGSKSRLALKLVLKSCLGQQAGAFSVYLLTFVFGQYVAFLARSDLKIGVAYADVQVLCGAQTLLVSRLYLLVEGRLLQGGRVLGYSVAFALWALLFATGLFLVMWYKTDVHLALFYGAVAVSSLGTNPLGTISQFMKDRFRVESLFVVGAISAGLAGGLFWGISGDTAAFLLGGCSTTSTALLLSLRSVFARSGYFIQPSSRSA